MNAYKSLHSLLITCDCTTIKHMLFNGLEISSFAKYILCQVFLRPCAQELYLDNLLHTIFISGKHFHTFYIGYVGIKNVLLLNVFRFTFQGLNKHQKRSCKRKQYSNITSCEVIILIILTPF